MRRDRMTEDEKIADYARRMTGAGGGRPPEDVLSVVRRIARVTHVASDVHREEREARSFGERLADRIAAIGGSWSFLIGFGAVILVWIVLNVWILARVGAAFDPYPFILLNLFLSLLAAVQAPIIMMSQNRQAARDRFAASHDYEVNLKAEIEIMSLHEKLDRIREGELAAILARLEALERRNGV